LQLKKTNYGDYRRMKRLLRSARFREFISHLEPVRDRRTVGTLLGQEDRSE
jgi:hypothetical protein